MNQIEHAEKLRETGEYNAHSALLRVNKLLNKESKLNKTQFLQKLRRAYFLNTGVIGKPHDPKQNKPFSTWINQGFARIEKFDYQQKGSEKTGEYTVAVFSEKGMDYVEKIINDDNYTMLPLKLKLEKQQQQPVITEFEKDKERAASEIARQAAIQQLFDTDKAS
jgi:hypothetical protein